MRAMRAYEEGTVVPQPRIIDIRRVVGYVALFIFVAAAAVSGFLFGAKWGFLALSLTSGIAAYLLGAE